MSLPMALVDFLPVGLFLAAAILLQRDLYNKMSKGAFALFAAGTLVIFVAGLFKAIWKLLYSLQICDFVALNKTFFPMQTVGFVLAAAGTLALLTHRQGTHAAYGVAAVPVYESSVLFVILMVLGVLTLDGSMIRIAAKRKQSAAIALYAVSLLFTLGMGYLSTRDAASPALNWAAEGVNIIGQGAFLGATLLLHKNGLAQQEALA